MVKARYLLDSNTFSEPMRPMPKAAVVHLIEAHGPEIALAAPVWHELVYGTEFLPASKKRQALEHYLWAVVQPSFPLLPYDRAAAEWHARERARLRKLGSTPPFIDGQIAAIARVNGLVLVTMNRIDFERFTDLEIEDWGE